MFTYADPSVCPSCREPLPQPVPLDHRCTTCEVALSHPRAAEAYAALERVDVFVQRLRSAVPAPVRSAPPAPVHASSPALAPPPPPPPPAPTTATWAEFAPGAPFAAAPPEARTGIRTSSVPAILLSLGALCLLVAAVIFLAVAWSALGVGGRTGVLAAVTLATAAGGLVLHHRGLRLAPEALVTVSLGLLVLDVLGAEHAGWIGGDDGLDGSGLALTIGLVLAAAGAALAATRTGSGRLVAPQVTAVVGLFLAQAALPSYVDHALLVAGLTTVGFVALAAAARTGHDLAITAWTALAAAALTWLDLAFGSLVGLSDLDALTLRDLWTSASGFGLLAAALLLLAPLAVHRHEAVLQSCATLSATMLTGLVALPVLDNGTTQVASTSLVLGLLWTAVAHAVPRARMSVPAVPAGMSMAPAALVALGLGAQALVSVLDATRSLRLDPPTPYASPALLVPTVAAVAALLFVLLPATARRSDFLRIVAGSLVLAAVATLALQPVPLWTVVALLGAVGASYGLEALRRADLAALVQVLAACALLLVTVGIASPSTGLLLVPLALLVAVAGGVLAAGHFPAATEVGGLLLPPALAGLTWVLGDLAGLEAYRAVPVLVVLAAVAMAVPRPELEATAAVVGAFTALLAIPLATDQTVSLALHLTLTGALVVAHSLVHPSRRPFAWVGTGLLVLATWVRLVDVGVQAPEPYTLPIALLLVAFGLDRMRRDHASSTALVLLPGLLLATVPTFLQVLSDPVTTRAALLGLACLVLVVGGAQLRWSAPLLVGSVIGGLLTLVELAPYAAQTPQWVVIGLAGTALVAVGITWERRVVELQRAAQFVGRLR